MIKKILFATDLGAFTPHALLHVESLSRQYDAKICLLHVVPPLADFTHAIVKSYCSESVKKEILDTQSIKGVLESVRDEVYEMIAANRLIEGDLLERISEVIIVPGKPANVILVEAERVKADLIVIGSHGTEALHAHLLGSVSIKVLQLAKVPVLMVPMMNPEGLQRFGGEGLPTRFGT